MGILKRFSYVQKVKKEIKNQAELLFDGDEYDLKFINDDDRSFVFDVNEGKKPSITIGMLDVLMDEASLFDKMIALRHEYRHIVQQKELYNGQGDNVNSYSFLAGHLSDKFYYNNYKNLPYEIDAEAYGVKAAYEYMKQIGAKDADELVLNYIQNKVKCEDVRYTYSEYKNCNTVDDVWSAFEKVYEKCCNKSVIFDNSDRYRYNKLVKCVEMSKSGIDEYKCIASYQMCDPENKKLYHDSKLSIKEFEIYDKAYDILEKEINSDRLRLAMKNSQRNRYTELLEMSSEELYETLNDDTYDEEFT